MKIFFYINTLSTGGAERVIANLANQFSASGHDVAVINSFRHEHEYPLDDNITHYYLEHGETYKSVIKRNFGRIKKLRRILKTDKPDVLVSFMREANIRAVIACMGLKTRTVISVRNDPDREYAGAFSRLLAKTLLTSADGCVFQTNDAKKWFPKKLQKKSEVIPNAVKRSFFEIKREPVPYRIVTCGRLTAQKNQKMQIDAVSALSEKFPRIQLLIYGAGELRDELRKYIDTLGCAEHVMLMGETSDVEGALSEASGFVLTSDHEGMPNALMEAMAAGVPCISTDCPCGGPKELIENGKNGFLIPVGDTEELVRKISILLSDDSLCSAVSERSKESGRLYLPDAVLEKWEKYLKKLR